MNGQSLQELYPKASGDSVAIAISHSCDIANDDLEAEPSVEFALGCRIESCDGNFVGAKNPRKLHLHTHLKGDFQGLEVVASRKFNLLKVKLHQHQPDNETKLVSGEVKVLQSWLAARYKRQTLPDSLQERLRPLFKKMDKLGGKNAQAVLGYWLDYQPREELKPENPYEVWLSVVYSTEHPEFEKAANDIAESLNNTKNLTGLDLIQCAAYSEEEFTLKDLREQVQYRAEHLSYRTDPHGPVV